VAISKMVSSITSLPTVLNIPLGQGHTGKAGRSDLPRTEAVLNDHVHGHLTLANEWTRSAVLF
jgi:hypothetical protein